MKRLLLSLIGLLVTVFAIGQVTTEPANPRPNQTVKIIYDATQGTSGLQGAAKVYMHSGVIIDSPNGTTWEYVVGNWGQDDGIGEMTRVEGETNKWEITITPTEYYPITANDVIYRLGMVFRNADGSREGKNASNGDIFVNMNLGFDVRFDEPANSSIAISEGTSVNFKAAATEIADFSFKQDGVEIGAGAASLTYEQTVSGLTEGSYTFQIDATFEGETKSATREVVVFGANVQEALPEGTRPGINYIDDQTAILVLQAPNKANAFVIGDFTDWEINAAYQMKQTPDQEFFWLQINDLTPGEEYLFQYLVDGRIRIADPYAKKVAFPNSYGEEEEITAENRYPGLKPYPAEKTNFAVSYLQTAQTEYAWINTDYEKPAPEDLVIYELLVRDFTDERTYNAVTERLDYLQSLGINAIELMPVMEFEGNLSWGYNPAFFFAPDKYYGTENELKRLIDEAHGRGMVVIMDMVLNHAYGRNPMVRLYSSGDYGPPNADNPWFNIEATHPFSVGYDFNHESEYTKSFVDSVNRYWIEEYKIDGYRYDLSKGFTQVNSGGDVGLWGRRDDSRIALLKRMYDKIRTYSDAYVILEHFADNEEEKILADYGMMLWGNMNGDFRNMAKGASSNFNWAYHGTRNWEQPHLIAYMESHDEERLMWESLNFGATNSTFNVRQLPNAVRRNQMLAAFFFSIPGPKMLWQFGEFGYDEELNDDRLGVKPTRWEYLDDPDRSRLFGVYANMAKLKTTESIFKTTDVTLSLNSNLKKILLQEGDTKLFVVGNFASTVYRGSLGFPEEGTWYDYLTGEEVQVNRVGQDFRLEPSQFHVLINKPITFPEEEDLVDFSLNGVVTNIEVVNFNKVFKLYPNPTNGVITLEIPSGLQTFEWRIHDLSGREVLNGRHQQYQSDAISLDMTAMKAGIYMLEIFDGQRVYRSRISKQ